MTMKRWVYGAAVAAAMGVLTVACGDDEVDASTTEGAGTSGDGDGDPSGDGDGDPSGDGDGDPSGDGDGDGDPSGDGDGDASGDGDGDASGDGDGDASGDGDGDPVCDQQAFVGEGLARDGWGEGSFCDRVSICADGELAETLSMELGLSCQDDGQCPDPTPQLCVLSDGGEVDAGTVALACEALALGAESVACVVFGP